MWDVKTKILILVAIATASFTASSQTYDELQNLRGLPVYSKYQSFSETKKGEMLREAKKAFLGDNYLHPLPRILTAEEKDFLQKGVEQRARALTAFLKDHFSGVQTYKDTNIFPPNLIQKIIKSQHLEKYYGYINPSQISFLYGPDIIRDSKGVWRVVEDNPGFIGGVGDLELAQKQIFDWYKKELNSNKFINASKFYKKLADRYKARARQFGSEKVVLLLSPPYADNEDFRIRKLLDEHGIETVTPYTNRALKVSKDGVFIYSKENPEKRAERVGFVILHSEPYYFDATHPASFHQIVLRDAMETIDFYQSTKKLKKDMKEYREQIIRLVEQSDSDALYDYLNKWHIAKNINTIIKDQIPGLFESIFKGTVGANNTPGIDFIGDKQFYLYVEKLIEFYLKEEPLLRNIKTSSFSKRSGKLNDILFQNVFSNIDHFVIKKVDGRGGDEVWVGPKISSKEKQKLKKLVKANPDHYITQTYTPLSEMDGLIVDLRTITDVYNNDIYVAETPWGRGLPKSGSGKVNLSGKGREVTVLVSKSKTASSCPDLLSSITKGSKSKSKK